MSKKCTKHAVGRVFRGTQTLGAQRGAWHGGGGDGQGVVGGLSANGRFEDVLYWLVPVFAGSQPLV